MIIDLNHDSAKLNIATDICILGAGAAGITLALELAADKSRKITLLEGGGKNYEWDSQSLYQGSCSSPIYPKHFVSRLRFLGGTTNHWEGSCRTLNEIDFEQRDWVANSGWPINKQELDPYYERAHHYCGLNEYNYNIGYWEKRSTLQRLYPDTDKIITMVNQHSTPTQFGVRYKERLEQSDNIQLCIHANVTSINESNPIGRIDSVTITNNAQQQGTVKAKLFILAMGGLENSRILLLSSNISSNGIGNENDNVGRYYMDHPGVKAAAIIPTALWPQATTPVSSDAKHNNLSWSGELNNKLVRKKRLTNARLFFTPQSEYQLSEGVESMHQLKKSFKKDLEVDSYFSHAKNILFDLDMVAEAYYRKQLNKTLFDSSEHSVGYLLNAMMEQSPDQNNRITLSNQKDRLGLNKLHLQWQLSEQDKQNFINITKEFCTAIAQTRMAKVRVLVGENDDTNRRFEELLSFGFHHMGGTRMHNSPHHGVVDLNLKVFNRNNFYIAGSSVFPTGGYVPPTLTIVALAIRLADHIKRSMAT